MMSTNSKINAMLFIWMLMVMYIVYAVFLKSACRRGEESVIEEILEIADRNPHFDRELLIDILSAIISEDPFQDFNNLPEGIRQEYDQLKLLVDENGNSRILQEDPPLPIIYTKTVISALEKGRHIPVELAPHAEWCHVKVLFNLVNISIICEDRNFQNADLATPLIKMNVLERMEQIMGIIFIIILGTGGVLTTLRTHWEEVELAWEVAGTLFAVVAVWKASAW
jgi:hypothetical protein